MQKFGKKQASLLTDNGKHADKTYTLSLQTLEVLRIEMSLHTY
jgi:hypothetical protein